MKHILWLIVFAILLISVAPGMAQTLEFTSRTDPVSLIGAYYNAISRRDYQSAYSFWETPPDNATLEQFAAGFADTQSARAFVRLPIVTDAGAGNIFASLPTLVIATRTDSSQQIFAGCFTTHRTNVPVGNATEPDPSWFLRDATLQPQGALDFAALENVCEQSSSLVGTAPASVQFDPATLIGSYFSAIVQGNPNGAAAYWENQSENILNTVFGRYFTDAQSVNVYVDPQIFGEGAAGSAFARVRTLALVTAAGGDLHILPICLTTRKSNVPAGNATEPDPNWFFYDARIIEAASVTDALDLLPMICT
jgi:hypothetical protein